MRPGRLDDRRWAPLTGPGAAGAVAALMDAEESLAAAEVLAAELARTVPGGTRLRDRVEQDVVAAAGRLRGGDRRRQLRDLVGQWKAQLGRPVENRRIGALADRLALAYSALLLEEFRAEFDLEFAAENPAEEIRWKEAEKAAKDVDRLRREVEKCRKATDHAVLRQHMRHDPPEPPLALMRAFVAAWRTLAPRYAVPVTINGTRIDSLPDESAEDWSKAFAKCGCKCGTGDGMAVPGVFRAVAASASAPREVPAMFGGRG